MSAAIFADSNGLMVQTALQAAEVFNDDGLREFAVKSLERVLLTCYKPGAGVAHYFDGQARVRGLLADQFAMAAACLDVFDPTGNIVYEMMAEELAHYALRTMWDRAGRWILRSGAGGRRPGDRTDEQAAQTVRHQLRRVTHASSPGDRLRRARIYHASDRTLAAMAPFAADQGPLAAHYLLARRAVAAR